MYRKNVPSPAPSSTTIKMAATMIRGPRRFWRSGLEGGENTGGAGVNIGDCCLRGGLCCTSGCALERGGMVCFAKRLSEAAPALFFSGAIKCVSESGEAKASLIASAFMTGWPATPSSFTRTVLSCSATAVCVAYKSPMIYRHRATHWVTGLRTLARAISSIRESASFKSCGIGKCRATASAAVIAEALGKRSRGSLAMLFRRNADTSGERFGLMSRGSGGSWMTCCIITRTPSPRYGVTPVNIS